MADLGEGPVGPGLPLIVRPPPPLPYLKVCIRRWGGCYHIKLGRLKTLHWLKICMINSSDQKKATVADPDLQIRGLGGGRGGMRSSIPEIREGPGLPKIYSQFTVNSALRARWLFTISYPTRPGGITDTIKLNLLLRYIFFKWQLSPIMQFVYPQTFAKVLFSIFKNNYFSWD